MKVYALVVFAALQACQQPAPPRQAALAEMAPVADPFSGRILENSRGMYGEVSALRDRSGPRLRTAVAYRTSGMTDPTSGEDVVLTVSGVEVECDAGPVRYTYHQGRSANGEVLYQVALPESGGWNSGDRIAPVVRSLCGDLTSEDITFEGVADFLSRTVPRTPPVDAVVSVTP